LLQEVLRRGLTLPQAEAAPLSFREFVTQVKPRYQWYHHCEVLAAVLQKVADGKLKRVMIFMPPRHGKSELASRLFAAYYLYLHPDKWVGINSYGADLAYTLSRAAQENYTRAGGAIKGNAGAVKHWETESGGGMWAAGVGGPITGKGFHLGIIDDPLKNAEGAASEKIREKQKEWYGSTFYTREEPGGAVVVIQTRWHEDDLSGYLLSEEPQGEEPVEEDEEAEGWHIVSLPALAEESDTPFPASCTVEPDWRSPGEPLCEERYSLAKLKKICRRIGEYFWGALFQQRPRPKSGGMFQKEHFDIVPACPAGPGITRVRYWDKAGAEPGKGDYTVGVRMSRTPDGLFYIEDVVRFQKSSAERNAIIRQTAELDRQSFGRMKIWIEQPPGLAKESTEEIIRQLAGFPVEGDPVNKDKIERADGLSSQSQVKNIKLVSGDWNKDYLTELCAFPHAKHDDQVDASSGAFNKLSERRRVKVW
jgi:predicted phage terminase large subunit-like protein